MDNRSENLMVVTLHQHPQLIEECCLILNDEWPRSKAARIHDLSKSSDALPCSLVLVKKGNENGNDEVIGHSKVGLVAGQSSYCSIKSVVISKKFRGQGMGKLLMLGTESYAINLGFHWCCLTTHDQQGFYKKLGYSECSPMCFLASGKTSLTSQMLEKMETSKLNGNIQDWSHNKPKKISREFGKSTPPPPPPHPPSVAKLKPAQNNPATVTWMNKQLFKV